MQLQVATYIQMRSDYHNLNECGTERPKVERQLSDGIKR